ncbi:MAG: hypothetical protein HY514_03550 [Candidatus Aenigmarchaeota archaeon]|nr:hypothetical protein [Candidatus Aenigmarchaeota archaeon]
MELSTRAVVIIAILVMLLVTLASFFIFQSGSEISKAEAQRIFGEQCIEYEKKRCSWDVTEEASFDRFVASCKLLYGQEREALSCLYAICGQCRNFALENVRCEGICRGIDGQKKLGHAITETCNAYSTDVQCSGVRCGVCS